MRCSPTDVDRLVLPERGRTTLGYRKDRVVDQRIAVNLDWWNARLAEWRLPGGPVSGRGVSGTTVTGRAEISRGDIFVLARDRDSAAVFRLLWHVLAWGSGSKLRGNRRRLVAVAADTSRVADVLERAATAAGSRPGVAYALLYPDDRRAAIPYLGPAFLTKYLYFAGGGVPDHPSVILDSRVATRLRDEAGWTSLDGRGGWPASTYERYCRLLRRWAAEESNRARQPICADEIERWLFDPGQRSGRWGETLETPRADDRREGDPVRPA